jgi:glutathionyl-hydroquinone reductase
MTAQFVRESGRSGEFVRQPNAFRNRIVRGGEFPPEPGRYHLIVSLACPWAHRAIIARRLLGLEDSISLGVVDPIRDASGWRFTLDPDGRDPVSGAAYLSELYLATDPSFSGRWTVPSVYDRQTGTIVTNDYPQLTLDLSTEWGTGATLYPEELRAEIDAVNEVVFTDVNNGVYRAGFATSQEAYEQAYSALFARLDRLSDRLAGQRYLVGDTITEADVRLFTTLVRFDAVYHGHFKCNRQKLAEFGALWAYARDLYQTPGFGDTVDFDHIKRHYYQVHTGINPTAIVPLGPEPSAWLEPHHREELGGSPFGDGTPPEPLTQPLKPLPPLSG